MNALAMEIKPAVRERTHVLVSISGPSGSGKTYSALLMARGIVGQGGKIGFIDTEAKRARHHADLTLFDVLDLSPPFGPLRYKEAVQAFVEAGYSCLVIDSASHEWEGTGGCIEMADGGKGLQAWKLPKSQHLKLMNYLLQVPIHIIFCVRAKEKMIQVPDPDKPGKDMIISKGFQPITEKGFIFEMTVSMMLDEETKIPRLTKCPEQLLHAFPDGQRITSTTGEALAKWAEQGVSLDEEFEKLKQEGRDVASMGTERLRQWFKKLTKTNQASVKPTLDGELKSIAEEADRQAPEVQKEDDPFADT